LIVSEEIENKCPDLNLGRAIFLDCFAELLVVSEAGRF